MSNALHRSRRDPGTTLLEVVFSIGLMGILAVAILGAIAVVFRNEDGVGYMVTESHDVQQAVSYLPRDVQNGPTSPDAYLTDSDPSPGSGCSSSGSENVLRIDNGATFVAYRVYPSEVDGIMRLDRYECTADGVERLRLNIADRLVDDGTTPPASARLTVKAVPTGPVEVDRVTLTLEQSFGPEQVSGSPRSEEALPAAAPGEECTNDPMEETLGFATFVKGDVRLLNNPQIKWASAIGGTLSFSNSANIGQNLNDDSELPSIQPFGTALYIRRVDWTTSSGSLTIFSNRDVVIDDRSNTAIPANGKSAYELGGSPSNPKIVANGTSQVMPIAESIDFEQAFSVLRACSVALAKLPDQACSSCAVHLELLDQNASGPYPGVDAGTNMKLRLVSGKANVLNISADDFSRMKNMTFEGTLPSQDTPFVVNIMDEGTITLDNYPGQGGIGSWVESTIWNFPNAERVILNAGNDGVWGTVYAPRALVESSVKIEGGVVAASWIHDGREVNGPRLFGGLIDWDS